MPVAADEGSHSGSGNSPVPIIVTMIVGGTLGGLCGGWVGALLGSIGLIGALFLAWLLFVYSRQPRDDPAALWLGGLKEGAFPPEWERPLIDIIIPNRVHPQTFANNLEYLAHQGSPLRLGPHLLGVGVDYSPSNSAREFERIGDRPSGYPLWFLAAFPDVASWMSQLVEQAERDDATSQHALSRLDERLHGLDLDARDAGQYLTAPYLRLLVDWYKETTQRELECAQ